LHQPLESCRYRQGADKGGACDAGGRRYGRRDPVNIGVFRRSVVYRLSFGRRDDTNSEEIFATLPPGGIGSFGRYPEAIMKI
jgi:hypothetical protein